MFKALKAIILGLSIGLFLAALTYSPLLAETAPTDLSADSKAEKPSKSKKTNKKKKMGEARPFIFASVKNKNNWTLLRMLPLGKDKRFLSQVRGQFLPFPPPDNKGDDFGINVSPDGNLAAYYSSRSGAVNLWLMNSDGTMQKALTHSDVDIVEFDANLDKRIRFSPDSKSIAFVNRGRIWKWDLILDTLTSLTSVDDVKCLDWSQDGSYLLYVNTKTIRQVLASGADDKVIVSDACSWPHLEIGRGKKKKHEFIYSRDGVFLGDALTLRTGFVAGSTLVPNHIRYSPDEKTVAFLKESPEFTPEIFMTDLKVQDRKSSSAAKPKGDTKSSGKSEGLQQITRGGASFPMFSPTGKSIYFLRDGFLWNILVTGELAKPLTSEQTVLPAFGILPAIEVTEAEQVPEKKPIKNKKKAQGGT